MTYDVRGVYEYYKSATLVKTVQRQQVFLQLIMIYTRGYFMREPFLNIFLLNYLETIMGRRLYALICAMFFFAYIIK